MKTYEKPQLAAISLAGNERLCGDCAPAFIDFVNDNEALIKDIAGDFGALFNSAETCQSDFTLLPELDAYCKFTSVDGAGQAFMS